MKLLKVFTGFGHHSLFRSLQVRLLPFVMIVVGGVAASILLPACVKADTLNVTAIIPAPLPSGPAIITYPHDQDHFATPVINVSGTCPPDSYVALYRNGIFSGTALCDNGAFTIQTSLVPGANQLQVKVYNKTDNEGPPSGPITVYYDLPAPGTPAPATPIPLPPLPPGIQPSFLNLRAHPIGMPLYATYPYRYQTHYATDTWAWNLIIDGGSLPYKVIVDWGDQTISTYENSGPSPTLHHAYTKAGMYHPLIWVLDTEGNIAVLQLLAVVNEPDDLIADTVSPSQFPLRLLILLGIFILTIIVLAIAKTELFPRPNDQ